jgi:prepilin-type N-terminal cleavage/methylation domain-containing protein
MNSRIRAASRRARSSQAGFSFIEILIVMGIISVLVGGVVVVIGLWAHRGPIFATQNTITKTRTMIENWKRIFETYPPGQVERIALAAGAGQKAQTPENHVNEGIEAVYQALYWPGFTSDPEWTKAEVGNTDEDKLRKAVNKLGTKDLNEIVDAWGNPLVYFHHNDYLKYAEGGASYRTKAGDDVEPKPYRNDDGTFINPQTFQIWSMGEDGIPNTDDDVLPWDH